MAETNIKRAIPSTVAGMFYPDKPDELHALVQAFLAKANHERPKPKAMIVPHAGFVYSGAVAAEAYACLSHYQSQFDSVVLVGPSHRYPLEGIAVPSATSYDTPLGEILLNSQLIAKISSHPQVSVIDSAFELQENSLETQLPFLKIVLPRCKIMPLLIGNIHYLNLVEVLNSVWNGENTLIVISSDLSHYYTYAEATRLDKMTAQAILELEPEKIRYEQACGRTGIQALLTIAKGNDLKPALLDLRNSGDTAGPSERVVGYGAFHFYEKEN